MVANCPGLDITCTLLLKMYGIRARLPKIMVFIWSNKLHCKYFVIKTHRVKHYVLNDHYFYFI